MFAARITLPHFSVSSAMAGSQRRIREDAAILAR
jgi:hypothetical protein